jgi:hypothetical protein
LTSIKEQHVTWELGSGNKYPSTASFEDSHCAFLKASTWATDLGPDGLGVITEDEGPVGDCGICSPAGSGECHSRHLLFLIVKHLFHTLQALNHIMFPSALMETRSSAIL